MKKDEKQLEIYKLAAEMSDRVSSRRLSENGFFLSVNTILVTLLGFMYEKLADDKRAVLLFVAAVGIVLSLTWFFSIRSFKRLNRAKFAVINEMEKDLPYRYFTDEWEKLKQQTNDESSKTFKKLRERWLRFKDRYTELTNIEAVVPIVFTIIYSAIFLGAAFKVIIK